MNVPFTFCNKQPLTPVASAEVPVHAVGACTSIPPQTGHTLGGRLGAAARKCARPHPPLIFAGHKHGGARPCISLVRKQLFLISHLARYRLRSTWQPVLQCEKRPPRQVGHCHSHVSMHLNTVPPVIACHPLTTATRLWMSPSRQQLR